MAIGRFVFRRSRQVGSWAPLIFEEFMELIWRACYDQRWWQKRLGHDDLRSSVARCLHLVGFHALT